VVTDVLLAAERGLFERDAQVLLQRTAVADLDAERAQQVAEDAIDVELAHVERHAAERPRRTLGADRRGPEAIEGGPLLGIAEDLVGGVELLEALVCPLIARILVGVMLRGEPPERALDLLLRGGAVYPQDVVGIAHDGANSIDRTGGPGEEENA